jgi:pimeloyl-ACP methyl ester carboxylesterase
MGFERLLAGSDSDWKGHRRKNFMIASRGGFLIEPKRAAEGRPWLWRPEFFEAFNDADLALLERGWHLAFYKFSQMFGSPEAVDLMHAFQKAVVKAYRLAPKAALFGVSRGGLYAFNYAADHPGAVACLYLDAPVLDPLSWPGGFGSGPGSPEDWKVCLAAYRRTEEEMKAASDGPLAKIGTVARAGIPILLVAGDADEIVPFEENGKQLAERYPKAGGDLKLIVKPGGLHHPHGLADPAPIVDFVLSHHHPKKEDDE